MLKSSRGQSAAPGPLFAWPILVAVGCGTQTSGSQGTWDASADDGSAAADGSVNNDGSPSRDGAASMADGASTAVMTDGSARDGTADASGTSGTDAGGGDAFSPQGDGATGNTGFAVVTQRYDNVRSGANTSETILTVANVGGGKFGQLFSHTVDGHMYAQPLYLPGLVIGGATHNVVFVATEHDTVYAFDADSATPTTPLWTTSLGTPMNATVSTNGVNQPLSPGTTVSCQDMFPKTGITSTPVIDPATGRMYVVAKTFENSAYVQRLHALDVLTGQDVAGSPVVIGGSVAGTGSASVGGTIAFDPYHHLNRPGLLLVGGNVYVAFASHCDDQPYHGWLFAYSADTLTQKGILNTTPNGVQGGIWQSGFGLTTDGTDVFFVAGNGAFDSTNMGAMLGLSVVRARLGTTGLTVVDWWTAYNAASLNASDLDFTTGAVLLPAPKMLIAGGKDGNLYVIDPANMGKFSSGSNKIIQTFSTGTGSPAVGHIHGGPVYWNGPSGPTLYVWPESGSLRSYTFSGSQLNAAALSQYTGAAPTHPGAILSLSANGGAAGTSVVWATFTSTAIDPVTLGDAWHNLVPGVMYAFDATNLTTPIWTSTANKARDDIGVFAKFNPPVVANGRVYLATQGKPDGGTLHVYGLLP